MNKRVNAMLMICILVIISAHVAAAESSLFDYDPSRPLNAEVTELRSTPVSVTYHVWFDSVNGERVPALFIVPRGRKNMPTVLFMVGMGMTKDLGPETESMLAAYGFAAMMIDPQYVGERKVQGKDIIYEDADDSFKALVQSIIDNRRAIDFLMTRPEVDPERIGLIGVSLGSLMGSVVFAKDKRLALAGFGVGGANWGKAFAETELGLIKRMRDQGMNFDVFANLFKAVETLDFVDEFAPRPHIHVNGRFDAVVPIARGIEFYEASPEPKHIFLFDGGHVPPLTEISGLVGEAITFFQKYLSKNAKKMFLADNHPPTASDLEVSAPEGFHPLKPLSVSVQAQDPDGNMMMVKALFKCDYVELLLNDDGKNGDKTAGDGVYSADTVLTPYCAPGTTKIEVNAVDFNGQSSDTLVHEFEALEIIRPPDAAAPVLSEFDAPAVIQSGDILKIRLKVMDPNNDVDRVLVTLKEAGFSILLKPMDSDPAVFGMDFNMTDYIPPDSYTIVASARDKTFLMAQPIERSLVVEQE